MISPDLAGAPRLSDDVGDAADQRDDRQSGAARAHTGQTPLEQEGAQEGVGRHPHQARVARRLSQQAPRRLKPKAQVQAPSPRASPKGKSKARARAVGRHGQGRKAEARAGRPPPPPRSPPHGLPHVGLPPPYPCSRLYRASIALECTASRAEIRAGAPGTGHRTTPSRYVVHWLSDSSWRGALCVILCASA